MESWLHFNYWWNILTNQLFRHDLNSISLSFYRSHFNCLLDLAAPHVAYVKSENNSKYSHNCHCPPKFFGASNCFCVPSKGLSQVYVINFISRIIWIYLASERKIRNAIHIHRNAGEKWVNVYFMSVEIVCGGTQKCTCLP